MTDNRNTILAVILSGLVLIAWQYFYNVPQMEKQRAAQQASELAKSATPPASTTTPSTAPQTGTPQPAANAPAATQPASTAPVVSRDTAIASTPRVKIESPRLSGSISLKGARIDDLSLVHFRETVDPVSPAIVLYSPSGTPNPYYAEFGWVPASGSTVRIPDQNTGWQQEGGGTLTPSHPVTLYPFALISRHGTPQVSGYYILHEGLIGYLGDQGLQEYGYKKIDDANPLEGSPDAKGFKWTATNG